MGPALISLEVSGAANDRYHPEARAACADAYDAPRYSECLRHWEADCDQRQRERPCFNVGGRPELQARWPPHLPCTSAAQAIPRMKPLHNNEITTTAVEEWPLPAQPERSATKRRFVHHRRGGGAGEDRLWL